MLPDKDYAQLTASARLMAFIILEEVRSARLRKKLTQEQLAQKLGVTQSTISEWETGVTMPQLNTLMMLCMVLELPFTFGAVDPARKHLI